MNGFFQRTPYYILSAFAALLIFLSNGSVAYYYYVAVALVLISPVLACVKPKVFGSLTAVDTVLIASFCIYAAAAVLGMLVHGGWSWDEFNQPSKFLLVAMVFLAVRQHGLSEAFIVISAFFGVLAAASIAWYQSEFQGLGRVYGSTNGIISAFGLLALLAGYFSLVYLVLNKASNRLRCPLGLVTVLTVLYAIAETGTKGVWIALPGGFGLLVLLTWNGNKRAVLFLGSAFSACLVAIFFFNDMVHSRLTGLWQPLVNYINTGIVSDGSLTIRLETWKASIFMFIDNPMFGVGLGGFVSAKTELILAGVIDAATGPVGGPHNDLLGALAIQGLVGFAALLFMYYAFLRLSWTYKAHSSELYWCSLGLIVIYVLSGLAGDRLTSNLTATYLALMMAIFAGQMSYKHKLFIAGKAQK
jgi:O-antigen ligase